MSTDENNSTRTTLSGARAVTRTIAVLCLVVGPLVATAASAQSGKTAPDATTAPSPTAPSPTAPSPAGAAPDAAAAAKAAKAAKNYPYDKLSETEAGAVLQAIEGRLSIGETVDAEDRRAISTLLVRHPSPRVRAQATSVLPWLGPDVVGKAVLRAMTDADPVVRMQALLGMNVISRRFETRHNALRTAATSAAIELLDDKSDDVACAAAVLLTTLAPAEAMEETRKREERVSDVRHGCFRVVAQVPPRAIRVEAPRPPAGPISTNKDETGETPTDGLNPEGEPVVDDGVIRGDGLFIATWAGAGLLLGGILPSAFSPPKDVLTYSRSRTSHAREEPSLISAVFAATLFAGTLGGGAWALSEFVGPLDFAAASAVTTSAVSAGLFGLGTSLAFGLDETGFGISLVSSSVLFMGGATALAYLIPPSPEDIALATSAAGLFAVAGGLSAFVAVPVGVERLFDDVDGLNDVARTDFGLGVALMTGGAASMVALAASPILDISPMRSAATVGGGIAGASIGVLGGFLLTPPSVDIRPRIAAGAGLVGEVAGAALAFFLVPDSWLGIVDDVVDPQANGAVVVKDGRIKLGFPQVVGIAPAGRGTTTAIGTPLVGGSF